MDTAIPRTALQLLTLLHPDGRLEARLAEVPVPAPADDEVLVRVEATPINPSDIGNLFGPADLGRAQAGGTADRPVLTAPVPAAALKAMAARVGKPTPVGNEGAGTVVAAGASPAAKALLGRRVALLAGGMYAQYRCARAESVLPLPDGVTAAEGASCFVNPLTALGMVETMRLEGHRALVHTAAASNLGQMLNRICLADGVPLVNIVRKPEQAALLHGQGAGRVCDSSSPTFDDELTEACAATHATLAFDAIGGGTLAGRILAAMEAALLRGATEFSRYGSPVHKQVYLYGGLDTGPTEIRRNFGMTWGIGGWLLFNFVQRIGPARTRALQQRVLAELKTTFASGYAKAITLAEVLQPDMLAAYAARGTGAKFLIEPARGA